MATAKPLVIVLSGSSSSGKTTLAHALRDRLPSPCLHIEADRAFPNLPEVRRGAELDLDHVVLTFHKSIAVWAASGFNLVVDGSLPYGNPQLASACLSVLHPYDLRLVCVRSSIPVLETRERARPDRPLGWAVQQSRHINDELDLDIEVDTSSTASPAECANVIIVQLRLEDAGKR